MLIKSNRIVYSGIKLSVVKGLIKFLKLIKPFLLMHFGILDIVLYNKFVDLIKKVEEILVSKEAD